CVVALCEFLLLHFFFFMWRCLPLLSTLFPYTTLFRSCIRRFVRDQQVFIFVDNTKRNGSRGNRVGALFREKNGQKVSRFWFLIGDRKSTRLNSSHVSISYAVFCLKKKKRMDFELTQRN